MKHYDFTIDLEMEINELAHINMVNGAEKIRDSYEMDAELISERLSESQELMQAASENGFSEADVKEDPIKVLAEIYYDGYYDLIDYSDLMDVAKGEDDCWRLAEDALIDLAAPTLTKFFKDLHDFVEEKEIEIETYILEDDYFALRFDVEDELEEIIDEHVDELFNEYAGSLDGEVFYTFHEKHTDTVLCQLQLEYDFINRAMI